MKDKKEEGEKEEMHLAYCKKCNQMTNHNQEGECLKCKGITVGWEYLFWNESGFAGDCVWNEKVADFELINKIIKKAQEEEREKWKLKIGELRNGLYTGLPVGEIKDAFEMIKLTNKHIKELDKLVNGVEE